ncbi:MAG TPA: 50S ribosomal protein L30 [Smithellaceae bacterium]|nr:50S ribosomal protein L30 [Smithellaceae bacterium]
MGKKLKITMIHSVIGRPEKQRMVLRGLGLTRIGKTVILADCPQVRGMVNKVSHLVSAEETKE